MSIARGGSTTRGFTIFEVIVTIGILTIMVLILQGTIDGATRAERRLRATHLATERGERITYELLAAVNGSRMLLDGDDGGDDYLAAIEFGEQPLLAGARLPRVEQLQALAPDEAGDPRTGNVLLFVRESDAVEAVADAASVSVRHIDLYRLVCVYPTQTVRRLIVDPPIEAARDLVVWRSVRYANLAQIQAIDDDEERTSVVADLVNRHDCHHAWDLGAPIATAYYAMGVLGTLSATPETSMSLEEDPDLTVGGRLVYTNVQLARTRAGDFHRRSRLTNDAPATWTPDGFEVKISGLSGARKVWMHVVVETPGGPGVVGVQSNTVIAHPRDL